MTTEEEAKMHCAVEHYGLDLVVKRARWLMATLNDYANGMTEDGEPLVSRTEALIIVLYMANKGLSLDTLTAPDYNDNDLETYSYWLRELEGDSDEEND